LTNAAPKGLCYKATPKILELYDFPNFQPLAAHIFLVQAALQHRRPCAHGCPTPTAAKEYLPILERYTHASNRMESGTAAEMTHQALGPEPNVFDVPNVSAKAGHSQPLWRLHGAGGF
jgi:hypothetical protein